jgi:hypothetical protein
MNFNDEIVKFLETTGYDKKVASGEMSATFAIDRVARHFFGRGRMSGLQEGWKVLAIVDAEKPGEAPRVEVRL